jgi:hypothetical protein
MVRLLRFVGSPPRWLTLVVRVFFIAVAVKILALMLSQFLFIAGGAGIGGREVPRNVVVDATLTPPRSCSEPARSPSALPWL